MIALVNPYVIIGLLVAWIGTGFYAYVKGKEAAENKAEIATQRVLLAAAEAQIKSTQKTVEVNAAAAEAWEVKARENEQALESAQDDIQELIDELKKNPPPPECLYTPADIERLRRGKAPAGGHGAAGTPGNAGNLPAREGPVSKGR